MKKMNNRTLAIILAVILILFIGTKLYRASAEKADMHTEVFSVKPDQITRIVIHPRAAPAQTVSLEKASSGWQVTDGATTDKVENGAVDDMLPTLSKMEAVRLVSRKKNDRDSYDVGDSTGTHVILYHDQTPLADFWAGTDNGSAGQSATYVRMQGKDDIYQATAGYLASSLDKPFDQWRDPTFLRIEGSRITRVHFLYPADTGFTLQKAHGKWLIDGIAEDSGRVASYVDKLAYQSLHHFVSHFTPPANPTLEISVGNDSTQLAVVDAWKTDSTWTLTSSTRPNVYFSSQGSDIISKLFVGKSSLAGK